MLPIRLRGARTHNLRAIDLDLPPGEARRPDRAERGGRNRHSRSTPCTPRDSGASSRASLPTRGAVPRARLERPPIDELAPIAATVAVDRRRADSNRSRSTLATHGGPRAVPGGALRLRGDSRTLLPTAEWTRSRDECHRRGQGGRREARRRTRDRKLCGQGRTGRGVSRAARVARQGRLPEARRRRERPASIDGVKPSEAIAPDVRVEVVVDRVSVSSREVRRLQQAIEVAWEPRGWTRRAAGRGDSLPVRARPFERGSRRGYPSPGPPADRARPRLPELRPRLRTCSARALLLQLAPRRLRSMPRLRAGSLPGSTGTR